MKKSEFYAAMCICIILCSMSTVFAVSYQPQIIQPTKIYRPTSIIGTNTSGTYFTVVDTVSGRGILNDVLIWSNDTATPSNLLAVKITIDGVESVINSTEDNSPLRGVIGSGSTLPFAVAPYNNDNAINIPCNLYFKTSLKIELKQTTGASNKYFMTRTIYATE